MCILGLGEISQADPKGWLPSAKLKQTFTFLSRDFAIFNTFSWQKSLPRKVKVGFSFALGSQPFQLVFFNLMIWAFHLLQKRIFSFWRFYTIKRGQKWAKLIKWPNILFRGPILVPEGVLKSKSWRKLTSFKIKFPIQF